MAKILPFNDFRDSHSVSGPLSDLARVAAQRVEAGDLARLGAGVRARLAAERLEKRERPGIARFLSLAAAAAAIGIASLAIVSEIGGSPSLEGLEMHGTAAEEPVFSLAKLRDGSVAMVFEDQGRPHSVTRSSSPQTETGRTALVSPGERYVDKRERSRPGSITYYRVN